MNSYQRQDSPSIGSLIRLSEADRKMLRNMAGDLMIKTFLIVNQARPDLSFTVREKWAIQLAQEILKEVE